MNPIFKKALYWIVIIAGALVAARLLMSVLSWVWSLVVAVAAVLLIVWVVRLVVGRR